MKQFGIYVILLVCVCLSTQIPVPAEQEPDTASESSSTDDDAEYNPPSLTVVGEDDNPDNSDSSSSSGTSEDDHAHHKRHRPTPSPEELEEKRIALIKSLGGGGGDGEEGGDGGGGGQLAASIMGLGSLATDVVSLLGSNANETWAPLREARQRARENFPDFGTQVNRVIKNGRSYAQRAFKSIRKNARVKLTNSLRFMLSIATRLATTIGGIYQVLVSLLDVTTRGVGNAARIGTRLLGVGTNATVAALARGTGVLKSLADSGNLIKPVNQAVKVGQGLAKGVGEDLFDQVEWAQEGINSKLELVQSLAPNFLLRAHESSSESPAISSPGDSGSSDSDSGSDNSDDIGGYRKLTSNEDDMVLLSLASTAAQLMQRGGRNVDMKQAMGDITSKSTTASPPPEGGPPQALLNDIFGLQEEIKEIKNNSSSSTAKSTTVKS